MQKEFVERSNLEIRSGGCLIGTYHRFDRETRQSRTEEIDHTNHACGLLFEPLNIEEDLLLKDLYLLINKNIDEFSMIFGLYYLEEYVREALESKPIDPPTEVHYLEMFFDITEAQEIWTSRQFLFDYQPQIYGRGNRKGKNESFCLEYMKPAQYIQLPLKLNKHMKIDRDKEIIYESEAAVFTLGNVIHGIFKELSFHGGPKGRDSFHQMLRERIDETRSRE